MYLYMNAHSFFRDLSIPATSNKNLQKNAWPKESQKNMLKKLHLLSPKNRKWKKETFYHKTTKLPTQKMMKDTEK